MGGVLGRSFFSDCYCREPITVVVKCCKLAKLSASMAKCMTTINKVNNYFKFKFKFKER